MQVEFSHKNKKKIKTLIEQTKTNSQEILDIKMDLTRQTFLLDNPMGLEKEACLKTSTKLDFFNSFLAKEFFICLLMVIGLSL